MIKKIETTEISFDHAPTLVIWRRDDFIYIKRKYNQEEISMYIGETKDLINVLTQYCERKN